MPELRLKIFRSFKYMYCKGTMKWKTRGTSKIFFLQTKVVFKEKLFGNQNLLWFNSVVLKFKFFWVCLPVMTSLPFEKHQGNAFSLLIYFHKWTNIRLLMRHFAAEKLKRKGNFPGESFKFPLFILLLFLAFKLFQK